MLVSHAEILKLGTTLVAGESQYVPREMLLPLVGRRRALRLARATLRAMRRFLDIESLHA